MIIFRYDRDAAEDNFLYRKNLLREIIVECSKRDIYFFNTYSLYTSCKLLCYVTHSR